MGLTGLYTASSWSSKQMLEKKIAAGRSHSDVRYDRPAVPNDADEEEIDGRMQAILLVIANHVRGLCKSIAE